jgi:hypothetical protein
LTYASQRQWSSLPFRASLSRPGRYTDHPLLGFVRSGTRFVHLCPIRLSSDLLAPSSTCSPASTPGVMSPSHLRPLTNHARSPVPTLWFLTTSSDFSAARSFGALLTLAGPESRGLVASRCQSWGSSRFWSVRPVARPPIPSPRRYLPLEGFHSSTAVPCHHGLMPS